MTSARLLDWPKLEIVNDYKIEMAKEAPRIRSRFKMKRLGKTCFEVETLHFSRKNYLEPFKE